jgi:hypothetical protein
MPSSRVLRLADMNHTPEKGASGYDHLFALHNFSLRLHAYHSLLVINFKVSNARLIPSHLISLTERFFVLSISFSMFAL